MNRPRVLCVSSDRSTRASITLSLADAPVTVVVAHSSAMAIDRLTERIDAVVVDASTVANVPGLVDTIEAHKPGTPTFVHWSDEKRSSTTVVTEVIDRAEVIESSAQLSAAITHRLETETAPAYDGLIGRIKQRLADATSPGEIERAIREEFGDDGRFVFAWVGEYDRGEREIVPWLTDVATVEWPMHRTFPIGDGSHPLLERTLHARELQTVQRIEENLDLVPLGEAAVDRDVQSLVVAPLATDDDLYGVLVMYGREPITQDTRSAIRAITETASYALESVAVRGRLDQREQALRRYERLVETAGDGMYVLDDEGHLTTINDALLEMTGYSREGLLGEHVSLLFDVDGVDVGEEMTRTLFESDRNTDTIEADLETKDGRTIPCEIQLAVLAHDTEYRGSVGVVRDITERKKRERTLRRQNERLDAFARIVSHDLRNPLGVAQGYLDLLAETESFEYVENVREGLSRMEAIIADVLAIAREGEWAAEAEPIDLESIATEAWENVSTEDASLSIRGSTTIEGDRSRVLRLLENVFRNAIEHGTDRSSKHADGDERGEPVVQVRVGVLESPSEVDAASLTETETETEADTEFVFGPVPEGRDESIGFYVEDDGRGMPEEIREQVFDSEFTTSSSGLGIGLWVVREVATGHGWATVATESEDGGARFEFVFDESN